MNSFSKKIFTFQYLTEQKNGKSYTNLFIKSWKNNLPDDYEIVILTSDNIEQYTSGNLPSNYKERSISNFYDYIAAIVLYENGGIFVDPTTIFTKKFSELQQLFEHADTVLFGDSPCNVHSGFIKSDKNSDFIEELIRRYRFDSYLEHNNNVKRNYIINDVLRNFDKSKVVVIDSEKSGFRFEKSLYGVSDRHLFQSCYFTTQHTIDEFFEINKGIAGLDIEHTPEKYINMDENEFLKQKILLAEILKKIS